MIFHTIDTTNCCVPSQDYLLRDNMSRYDYTRLMPANIDKERADRLKKARIDAGFKYASDFARVVIEESPTYRTYEDGTRAFSYDKAKKFGSRLGVSAEWIMTGKENKNDISFVPIVGRMIGGIITATHPLTGGSYNMQNKLKGRAIAEAPPELNPFLLFAIEICDDFFAPIFIKKGAVVYYDRTPSPPEECIGSLCVIKIKNGDAIFDILQRGKSVGVFDTQYHGKDIEIEWCAKRRFTKDVA